MSMCNAPIVFLGDSITMGWTSWHQSLFDRHNFIGMGFGGETSGQSRLRMLPALEDNKARGLHLLSGINDIAGNAGLVSDKYIQDNFVAMVHDAKDHGADVWLGSILPADHIPWQPHIDPRSRISDLNRWLRTFAVEENIQFLDYHSILATEDGALQQKYSYDGLHLSEQAYLDMEPMMLAALRPTDVET